MSLVGASVTPATWRGHGKGWAEWCMLAGREVIWSSASSLLEVSLRYLMQLRSQGCSAAVARRRLSGVRFHLLMRGCEDVTGAFTIRQALKGWRKEGVRPDSRRPISFELLGRLVEALASVCLDSFEVLLFKSSFTLAFFAALRVGELVSPSKKKLGGLMASDVLLSNGVVRICIRRSKTDIFSKGEWISLQVVPGPCCPVAAIEAYLRVRPQAAVFLAHPDLTPVTRFQFTSVLKKCLAVSRVRAEEFGIHSFRTGAATEAARAGLPNQEIRRIGRWRSECYASYIRLELLI